MDAYQILVIGLAVALAMFLILLSIALIFVIKILALLKSITKKAEAVADKVEHIGAFFEKTAGPAALLKLFANVADTMINKRSNKRRD